MIYSCYPGCGKTTLGKEKGYVDLESSCFRVNGVKHEDWFIAYAQMAKHLSDEGKTVFVSAHRLLRDYMTDTGIPFVSVYPSLELKEEWISKLQTRFLKDSSDKNISAYLMANDHFDENIEDMKSSCYTLEITSVDYVLSDLINKYEESIMEVFKCY